MMFSRDKNSIIPNIATISAQSFQRAKKRFLFFKNKNSFLNKKYKYLGMMGSKAKVATLRQRLLAGGISEAALESLHSPIGLPIGSDTPREIAVSIAAQLIGESKRKL